MEVILEIRLKNFVTVVILRLSIGLSVVRDIAHEKVGKRVTNRDRGGGIEGQKPVGGRNRAGKFVLLGGNSIRSKLEIMLANHFRHVIAERVSRVGIVWAIGDKTRVLRESSAPISPTKSTC